MNNEKWTMPFEMVSDITIEDVAKLTDYLYGCAALNRTAVLILSSTTTAEFFEQIEATIKAIGVKVVTLAFGVISNDAALLFMLGDERYVAGGASVCFNESAISVIKEKVEIPDEFLQTKLVPEKTWFLSEDEIVSYSISTGTYAEYVNKCLEVYKEEQAVVQEMPYYFYGQFLPEKTLDFVDYLYCCAAAGSDGVVEISSPGGLFNCIKPIIDTIDLLGVKLVTIGSGMVGSSAAILFLHGDIRVLKANAKLMVHEIAFASEMFIAFRELVKHTERLSKSNSWVCSQYLAKVKIPKRVLKERIGAGSDWTLSDDEIKKYHIVNGEYADVARQIVAIKAGMLALAAGACDEDEVTE